MKYEYKVLQHQGHELFEAALNELGKEGWQVVSVTPVINSLGLGNILGFICVFSREHIDIVKLTETANFTGHTA